MKKLNIFGETKTQNTLKDIINAEINRRYGFEKKFEPEYKPTFPFFKFNYEEQPTFHKIFQKLFEQQYVTNPLKYAKYLTYDKITKQTNQLEEAMEQLHKLAENTKNSNCDDYDFEINGVPVKIYQKFIQIGYTIIPFDDYLNTFNNIKSQRKKETILNIIFKIENNITTIVA